MSSIFHICYVLLHACWKKGHKRHWLSQHSRTFVFARFFPVSFLYDDNTDAEGFLPAMSPINLRGIESSSPTKFQHVYLRVPCISPASAGLLSTSYSLLNEAPLGTLSKREWHLLHQDRMKNKNVFLMTYLMDVLSIN